MAETSGLRDGGKDMITKTPYHLYFRDIYKNVHALETHKEKQYGDVALRAPDGSIVYVSTGPLPPNWITEKNRMGDEPNFIKTDKHLYLRLSTNSKRYFLEYARPTAISFNFQAKVAKWRWVESVSSWSARGITCDESGSNGIKLSGIHYSFNNSGGIRAARFHLSGMSSDYRWPVRVMISFSTGIGGFQGTSCYNLAYVNGQSPDSARYDSFSLPVVRKSSSIFTEKNLSVKVSSMDNVVV